jgi:hypothetical protein
MLIVLLIFVTLPGAVLCWAFSMLLDKIKAKVSGSTAG